MDDRRIGMENPGETFTSLVDRDVVRIEDDELRLKTYNSLSQEMRDVIIKLLQETNPDFEKIHKAVKAYQAEALFYNPYDYNDWIKEVKKIVIEKKLFNFWKNTIVKDDLGILWARNCDYFDDTSTTEPQDFYKIEGHEINLAQKNNNSKPDQLQLSESESFYLQNAENTTPIRSLQSRNIDLENPAESFKTLVEKEFINTDAHSVTNEKFSRLSEQMQNIIVDLLNQKDIDEKKIKEALKAYHDEASFYNPYDYNNWIKKVKEIVIEKNLNDFWKTFIVAEDLGLFWAKNCEYFDDMEDKAPEQFYKL